VASGRTDIEEWQAMTKTSFTKVITVVVVLLVCGTALAVVVWRTASKPGPSGEDSLPAPQPERRTMIASAPSDSANEEFGRLAGSLAVINKTRTNAEISKQVANVALRIKNEPGLVASLISDIFVSGDPDESKFQILALGVARTEQAKAALLKILVSDTDSKMKMLAAAAFALTSAGARRVLLPLPEGGVWVNAGPIDSEAVLQAIRAEWQYTEDGQARKVFLELLELSSGNSQVAAGALWTYTLEGGYKSEVLRRAATVARSLKSNTQTQTMLVGELLKQDNKEMVRLAAARILREQSVSTLEENTKTLVSAAKDDEADALVRGYAFHGMDSSIRNQIDLKELSSIIGSKDLPGDIRSAAIKEVCRRAPKIRTESGMTD